MARYWHHIIALASLAIAAVHADECDACMFDGMDQDDCRVYGKIEDELVPWYLGTQDCLDEYNIKISSADPELTCASSNSFVNALRFGELSTSTVRLGLGVSEGGFFEQDESGNPVLKDEITIDGVTYDCKTTESDCYNAMKPYFDKEPGATEMKQVCETLYNKVKLDREQEQSTLRIRLCMEINDSTTMPDACIPLWSQVQEEMVAYPNTACSGFGFGPGTTPIPGCDTSGACIRYSFSSVASTAMTLLWIAV